MRAAIDPTVFDAVKHRQFAAGEAEERDAHHVVARGVFDDGDWRAPCAALVVRMDLHEACRALIAIAAVELRVDEEDAAGLQCGEGAFRIARVLFGRFDVECDEALRVQGEAKKEEEQCFHDFDGLLPNRPSTIDGEILACDEAGGITEQKGDCTGDLG